MALPIVSDSALQGSPTDLGVRFSEGELRVPPPLAALLTRLRVLDGAYLPDTLENMPSFFVQALGLDVQRLDAIREALAAQIPPEHRLEPTTFQMPPLGAMPYPPPR